MLDKEDSIATPESSSNPDTKTSDGNDSPMTPLSIDTSSDLMKPLSIQTKFETSPAPSASSTDTSSEVGSAFNSPIQSMHCNFSQGSPNSIKSNRTSDSIFDDVRDIKKFLVIRMTSGCDNDQLKSAAVSGQSGQLSTDNSKRNIDQVGDSSSEDISSKKLHAESTSSEGNPGSVESKDKNYDDKAEKNENADQFSKNLLALLKTVETEIELCELNLFDEIEKRKKYKIDDCRRTHNYDQFICTFLSMLAEQGNLRTSGTAVSSGGEAQGVAVGRLHKAKKPDKRRRSRPKKRK
ncbi:ubiquitin carboxyl-terminal hydrolase BAP1 [Caerostris extrusa]|uniref:Ubiquitin carboxyl-terminal hydrolase BAP1 n=1 Tax=Caerostris extrusa TaxID=172846 RepID=A0AAV4VHH9_CAEEX|nr:ubiquitin carboxyl-terminal hydrolase BAP1 [Caerostris extrusa]